MNLETILPTIGYVGIFAIVFAESGLLIGFFLPGDSLLFTAGFLASQDHLLKAERFYEQHGKKTIVLARFMPIVRTFAPIVAGIGKMEYRTFIVYNIIGGFLWAIGLTGGGYILGNSIPNVDKYLLPIVATIIVLSILPQTVHILKNPNNRRVITKFIKSKIPKIYS